MVVSSDGFQIGIDMAGIAGRLFLHPDRRTRCSKITIYDLKYLGFKCTNSN